MLLEARIHKFCFGQSTKARSKMRNIAIFGSGRVGATLATGLAAAGHSLKLGVRNPETARGKWTGPNAMFASLAEASRDASVVINATPGASSVECLSVLRAELKGKVLIDVANATVRGPDGIPSALLYPSSSLAEVLQAALPETFVVKTLNTVLSPVMANPDLLRSPATIFVSGNDDGAKAVTRELLRDLGWSDRSIEDLGRIDSARGTEALILLVPYLIRSKGFANFALSVVR
ncbi:NADPH-dependent F420 reductase [Bradyrhizobium sp. 25ACV]